ncbi:small multidrug resistance protein [Methanohalobium evestigatum Z-7303]|uniref:Small multidrug resistance protein n=1 Tax=Methanohalobium evestigatum (strain ATCC BAA-1072 / DSM 3721 / NBRC 107634 / OCM 161 / Z-7303) TaxID=644295 RepID=D7E7A0_METEZ|nr:multidrug efflux SMR transporter [Methanohalobium evestigatum]ADI73849.1 small multidrug resistance protein [Methanohalobium evestigatum Z-7303]
MSYIMLLLGIIFEVFGTTCMKLSEGFARTIPSILIFVFYAISFTFVTFALKKIDVSVAYAIWAGFGTALITIIGIFWFKEPMNLLKMVSLLVVVIGIMGLHISDKIY